MRVLILTDRGPRDPEWKGAYVWSMVQGLAESQHEVMVLTTADTAQIHVAHPRLNLARPAPTFAVDRLPAWSRALLLWRPEIIHTFCLRSSALWPSLTVWPYLDAALRVFPDIKRLVTLLEPADLNAASAWYQNAHRWTTFDDGVANQISTRFKKPVDLGPLELLNRTDLISGTSRGQEQAEPYAVIPAPVSEWPASRRPFALAKLGRYLEEHPGREVWINGGWGELSSAERRAGWEHLKSVSDRVRLSEPWDLNQLAGRIQSAEDLYLDPLDPHSWRAQVARRHRAPDSADTTANHFSRLYLL